MLTRMVGRNEYGEIVEAVTEQLWPSQMDYYFWLGADAEPQFPVLTSPIVPPTKWEFPVIHLRTTWYSGGNA